MGAKVTKYGTGEDSEEQFILSEQADLAAEHYANKRYDEARAIYTRILERQTYLLGDDHPRTLIIQNNLAALLYQMKDFRRCERLYEDCLDKLAFINGEEHPDTIIAMNNLAALFYAVNANQKALGLFETVHQYHVTHSGAEHENTLSVMVPLASLYARCNMHKKAVDMYLVLIEKRRVADGEHDGTPAVGVAPAAAAPASAITPPATQSQRPAPAPGSPILVQQTELSAQNADLLTLLSNLAQSYAQLHDIQAEAVYLEILAKLKVLHGEEHVAVATNEYYLAGVYQRHRKYAEAEVCYLTALGKRERLLGVDHWKTLATLYGLGSLYKATQRYDEAVERLSACMEARKRIFGEDHPNTLTVISSLAGTYCRQQKYAQALALYRIVYEHYSIGNTAEGVVALSDLAHVHKLLGNWIDAESCAVRAMDMSRRYHGNDHTETIDARARLEVIRQLVRR